MLSALSLRARDLPEQTGDIRVAVEKAVEYVTRRFGPDTAGLIGVDARGRFAFSYNTWAMARGWGKPGEVRAEL